jgi:exodeoxyribonuclease VII small subunit
MPQKPKTVDFEKHLEELESLVAKLESGELSLDEALAAYERGVALTRECQAALDAAQARIQVVSEKGGEISATLLDADTE